MDTRDGLWNHPGEHTRVRSQECSLGYAPGDNMSGWRPRLIQAMSLAMPLGRFLGICAGYNHQCAPVPLGVYIVNSAARKSPETDRERQILTAEIIWYLILIPPPSSHLAVTAKPLERDNGCDDYL